MNSPLEKMSLLSRMLHDGYLVRLQVSGSSMSPFLETGSYVTLHRAPLAELKIGDIVFCSGPGGSCKLHRLLRITEHSLITKGDALGLPDPPFAHGDYLGRVVEIERKRPDEPPLSRSMELPGARAVNCCIAITHRLKLHLIPRLLRKCLPPAARHHR